VPPASLILLIDSDQIDIDEFNEALNDSERETRRQIIFDSGTLFARDLRGIQNEIVAVKRARRDGTIDVQRERDAIEKLRDDEAELMFEFDKSKAIGGFAEESQRQSELAIAQQEAQGKAAEAQRKEQETKDKERRKLVTDTLKAVHSDLGDVSDKKIEEETKRRLDLQDRLLGNPAASPAGSTDEIIAASQAQLQTIQRPPSPPPRGTALPTVVTDDDYAKIPPGSWFVDENGVRWFKPAQ